VNEASADLWVNTRYRRELVDTSRNTAEMDQTRNQAKRDRIAGRHLICLDLKQSDGETFRNQDSPTRAQPLYRMLS
jgi:hypothetical protein